MEEVTRKEVINRMLIAEKNKEFDKHVDPVNYDTVIKVDENYRYIKKGFKTNFKHLMENIFIIRPFIRKINKEYQTEVIGYDNLKGIKSAVITCNHVDMFDCLVVKKAVRPNKLHITAAPFNNQNTWLGEMMRAGGMMPMSETIKGMKNFNLAVNHYLKDSYVLFYPEQSMWWHYEKPRPYKDGAFHYASKLKKPVIPTFITFKELDKLDKEGIKLKKFYLHILKPIYPKEDLSYKENISYLRDTAFSEVKECYEEFYRRKLVYLD